MEFSLTHVLVVFGLAILFFGPSRLPKVGQSLGETIRQFKTALNTDPVPAPKQELPAAAAPTVVAQTTTTTTVTEDKTKV